ncbi:MAG: hypothetical protein ACOYXN_08845 [Acidobacteriota bacterium]
MTKARFLLAYFGIVLGAAVMLMVAFPAGSRPSVGDESSRTSEAVLARGLLTPVRHTTTRDHYLYVCEACDRIGESRGSCPNCGHALERILRAQVVYACEPCSVRSGEPGSCGSCGRDLTVVRTRPERGS